MSTTLLDRPSVDGNCVPVQRIGQCEMSDGHHEEQEIRIGDYLVTDSAFVRRAASDLMQRCVLHGCEIPSDIVNALHLEEYNRNAIGMTDALLHNMPDLHERRSVICLMIHEIVSLQ